MSYNFTITEHCELVANVSSHCYRALDGYRPSSVSKPEIGRVGSLHRVSGLTT